MKNKKEELESVKKQLEATEILMSNLMAKYRFVLGIAFQAQPEMEELKQMVKELYGSKQ